MPGRVPLWLWPRMLGLDAAIVALVWQDFVARCFAIPLRPVGRIMLGLTVWAIYLADRWLDARTGSRGSLAHELPARYPRRVLLLIAVLLGVDALLGWLWLSTDVRRSGLLLALGVALYLVVAAWWRGAWKRLSAALLFTCGVFLVGGTRAAHPDALLFPAFAFGLLCLANLLLFARWSAAGEVGMEAWPLLLLMGVALWRGDAWSLAIAISAAGLAGLALAGSRVSLPVRQVLADSMLLSPLLLWMRT